MSKPKKNECEEFVRMAHAALVLRGFSKKAEIHDPILQEIWRLGRKLAKASSGDER